MTIAQEFIKKLQEATGKEPLPKKFWEDYSDHERSPTFQDVLSQYAEYCKTLSQSQKDWFSKVFWDQVKAYGTPIIEAREDGQSEVYFLFPRAKLSESVDNPGAKKELYLQGDFHGYGSTLKDTQELTQLPRTDIMWRSNTMPRDALVTYYYVQLEPKYGNKKATDFYGDVAYQPPSFFPVKQSEIPADKPPAKTQEELQVADALFNGSWYGLALMSSLDDIANAKDGVVYLSEDPKAYYVKGMQQQATLPQDIDLTNLEEKLENVEFKQTVLAITSKAGHTRPNSVLIDEFSNYHKIYDSKSSFFRVDPDKDLSDLGLPVENTDLGTFFSDLRNKARVSLVSKDDKILDYPVNPEDLSKFSRSIHVFAPPGDADLDQAVIIHDGNYYLLGNTAERMKQLLSENTAVIFIAPEDGIEAEAKAKGVEFSATDALEGMGTRTVDLKYRVDEYAGFIHNELLPELVKRGIKIPDDPDKRVLVGSSLSGTASIYMGMSHPEWFGKVVAQSPSIDNRIKIEEIMNAGKKQPSPEIFLSCGTLECPAHAKNLNLPFAEELAEYLNVELHSYPHGHQMEGWSPQLVEEALPALGLSLQAKGSLKPADVATSKSTDSAEMTESFEKSRVKSSEQVISQQSDEELLASRQTTQQYKAAIKQINDDSTPAADSAKEQQDDDESSFTP